jgi:eukaryotic-like serine/threonine-protein kinase
MSPAHPRAADRVDRIRTVFLEALATDPDDRATVLDAGCDGDGALRDEVERLLAARADADSFLGSLARRARIPFAVHAPEPGPEGRRFGAYRVIRELSRGGMGAVCLAERADDRYEKQVAIKLLPPGFGDAVARDRFMAERRVLAQLDHPGIARLLDAGIAKDGTPYFVMEYVAGEPIDGYCDRLNLDAAGRIDLFLQVCAAVEYAHSRLIVHRDLKPANILVAPGGTAKLLDFGIAEVLDAGSSGGGSALSGHAGQPMTPAYASPEQVRGDTIGTPSDVYSLGVLLYQLLAGRVPYEVRGLPPAALEQLVCEREPIAPSVAAAGGGAPSRSTPAASATAAAGRARHLRGDLDAIVMTALRKEPARRYRSAAALADDLVRYRARQPVLARPGRLRYRAGKYVRRRPGVVAAIGIALLAATAYVATLAMHAASLEVERDRARIEAVRSERVSEFMVDLFREGDPFGPADPVTVREVLDRGSERVRTGLAEDPVVKAKLMDTLGEVYRRLGAYDAAEQLLTEALQIRRDVFGAEHVELAGTLRNLGSLHYDRGDFTAAIASHREALALQRRHRRGDDAASAQTMHNLANALLQSGEHGEAERLYRQAIAVNRAGGEPEEVVATNLSTLGSLLAGRGRYGEAEALLREALEIRRTVLGPQHARTAVTLNNLANMLRQSGDPAAAEPLLLESLEMRRASLGPDHPSVAVAVNNLALALKDMGRFDEADPLFRESLARRVAQHGGSHPAVATAHYNLGRFLQQAGRVADAEAPLREALAVWTATLRPEHPRLAQARLALGWVLLEQGAVVEAARLLREALAIYDAPAHADRDEVGAASALHLLAMALEAGGHVPEADSLVTRAHEIRARVLGADHEDTSTSRTLLERLRSPTDRIPPTP